MELYDLSTDISEKNNVAEANADLVKTLEEKYLKWEKGVKSGVKVVSK
ncbi:MAG: hypothetical protein ABFS35_22820 [Bacteroidota bacterium]